MARKKSFFKLDMQDFDFRKDFNEKGVFFVFSILLTWFIYNKLVLPIFPFIPDIPVFIRIVLVAYLFIILRKIFIVRVKGVEVF